MIKFVLRIINRWSKPEPKSSAWRLVAAYQRYQWRLEYLRMRTQIEQARQAAEVAKLLSAKQKAPGRDLPGYISMEISPLIQWLVKGNDGALNLLERAVSALALNQLHEVLGVA